MQYLITATALIAAVSVRAVPAPQTAPGDCNPGLCVSSLAAAGINCVGPPNLFTLARCLFGVAIPLNSEAVCGPCIPDIEDIDIPFPDFDFSNEVVDADEAIAKA